MPDLTTIADSLNQTALTGDAGALRQLLCSTPVSPPHGQAKGVTVKKAVPALDASAIKTPGAFGKARISGPLAMIGFIQFRPVRSNTDGQEGALTFDVKYADELKTVASRNGWIPCWFLPWKSGLLVKVTIVPDNGPIPSGNAAIDALPNPRLFFTAAINGCSVFAYGNATGPTVVHAGFESNFADKTMVSRFLGGNSASMWQALLKGVTASADGLTLNVANKVRQNLGEVHRYDYIRTLNPDGTDILGTPEAQQLKQYLDTNRKDVLKVKEVNPWGSVFGVRTGNTWEMTLQRNVQIQFRMITQKGGFLGLGKKEVDIGPGVAKPKTKGLDQHAKERIKKQYESAVQTNQFISCITRSYTDFFPGAAVNHALPQVQFW